MKKKKEIRFILDALASAYPDGICSLQYTKDYELLFATRLAAQCTDARVNQVTPILFRRYPTLQALAGADPEELSQIIHPCGFFRIKTRDILAASSMLLESFGGRVPDNREDLLRLPGVGRKTANLILGDIYQKPAIVADTHCIRLSGRIGLTDGSRDPYQVELQLDPLIPPKEQSDFCHRLVLHGREVCRARSPRCGICILSSACDYQKRNQTTA